MKTRTMIASTIMTMSMLRGVIAMTAMMIAVIAGGVGGVAGAIVGVVAITVAQRGEHGIARTLAHAYPLQPQALGPLLALLAEHYGVAGEVLALGRVALGDNGELGAPVALLH